MDKKGIINIVLVVVIILFVSVISYFAFVKKSQPNTPALPISPGETVVTTPDSSLTTNEGVHINIACWVDKVSRKPCAVGGAIIKTQNNVEVKRQKSEGNNNFSIYLNPGSYLVEPMDGSGSYQRLNLEPELIQVIAGKFTEVEITYGDGRR